MTTRTLTMPRLGETMEEGTIAAWLITPGTAFKRGQPLLEVETDKTVVEYPALGDGVLVETLVAPGDVVAVDAPIARIEATQWEDAGTPTPPAAEPAAAPAPQPTHTTATQPSALRATPAARRLARQSGVALESVQGTGRRGRIEAQDIPTGGAGTVLLLHGFAGDGATWAALTAALTRAGHSVLAPDLPGHGTDTTTPQGVEDLLSAITRIAANAQGKLHLVGHSLGGHLAALYAAANPDRTASLTLIAPAGLGREIDGAFVHGMAHARTGGEIAHLLRLLGPKAATLSPDALDAMAQTLAKGRLAALAQAIAGPHGQRIDTLGPLSRLPDRIPLRVLIGRDDRIIPAAHLFNLPPRAAVHVLPTGHMPQWDAPADVAALITKALTHA